jgi:hypothetical protein
MSIHNTKETFVSYMAYQRRGQPSWNDDGNDEEGAHVTNWLNQVKADPTLLPFKMSAWQALEADFKWSFIDYAEHEHTQDELRKLMKDSNVDEYIAAFQLLGHCMGMNLDDPSML